MKNCVHACYSNSTSLESFSFLIDVGKDQIGIADHPLFTSATPDWWVHWVGAVTVKTLFMTAYKR